MKNEKNSIVVYKSFFDGAKSLPLECKGELWESLYLYLIGEEYNFQSELSRVAWDYIKPHLDENKEKWNDTCKKRSEAGKKAMQKRWGNRSSDVTKITNVTSVNNKNNKAITSDKSVINVITKITDNDNVNDNDNDNVNDSVIVNNNSTPSIELILSLSKDPSVALSVEEANKFFDHYTAQNWLRSNGQQIPNTKAALISALRMWKGNSAKFDTPSKPTANIDYDSLQRAFEWYYGRFLGDYSSDPVSDDKLRAWAKDKGIYERLKNKNDKLYQHVYKTAR